MISTVLGYGGTALPVDATTEVLYAAALGGFMTQGAGVNKYVLRLRNSHSGTVLFEKSEDGVTFTTIGSVDLLASSTVGTNRVNKVSCSLYGYRFFRVRWTNGGTTQTTFDPMQALVCDSSESDEHQETEARVRAPVQDATNNFAFQAGTTSEQFTVPTAWKGRRVAVSVVGTALTAAGLPPTCWLVFGTADTVDVDRARFVSGTPPAFTGHVDIGQPIGHGDTKDYYVDPNWTHFAVEADVASTGVYIVLSDYQPQEIG